MADEPVQIIDEERSVWNGALVTVAIHGFLLAILLAVLKSVVPLFGSMFADFGAKLPWLTQQILDLAHVNVVFLLFPCSILLVADWAIYPALRRKFGKRRSRAWAWIIGTTIVLGILVVIAGIFLPIFSMGEIVSREGKQTNERSNRFSTT